MFTSKHLLFQVHDPRPGRRGAVEKRRARLPRNPAADPTGPGAHVPTAGTNNPAPPRSPPAQSRLRNDRNIHPPCPDARPPAPKASTGTKTIAPRSSPGSIARPVSGSGIPKCPGRRSAGAATARKSSLPTATSAYRIEDPTAGCERMLQDQSGRNFVVDGSIQQYRRRAAVTVKGDRPDLNRSGKSPRPLRRQGRAAFPHNLAQSVLFVRHAVSMAGAGLLDH